MRYLLDTNVFIAAMKRVDGIRSKLEGTALSDIVLSPVVLG
jgi:tRNA(fMet)-specific endonuclease VapC